MSDWPTLPDPIPADPYDEDGYCNWCGNGRWKAHGWDCAWADARDDASPRPTCPDCGHYADMHRRLVHVGCHGLDCGCTRVYTNAARPEGDNSSAREGITAR